MNKINNRTKYGSFEYMLKYGSFSENTLCRIYINKSTICKGNGVFAKYDIPENTIISWYYGYKKHKNYVSSKNKYGMYINDNYTLIGVHKIEKLKNKGVAQIINDGICSRKINNSYFMYRNKYTVVISRKYIKANQEVLASYGIDYWIHQIQIYNYEFSYKFDYLIKLIKYLEKLIENIMESKVLETTRWINNRFQFILKGKRKCFISEDCHDNDFYLNIEKNVFYTDIYYICKKCNSKSKKFVDIYLE